MDTSLRKYFTSLTHPKYLAFDRSSWSIFQHHLTKACDAAFPQTQGPYTSVHVLLLTWADTDISTPRDVDLHDFEEQWKTQFNFTTEIWKIPNDDPENSLEEKMSALKREDEEQRTLLIVYYGGYGYQDALDGCIWAADITCESPILSWAHLGWKFVNRRSDTLILLDCCFVGNAGYGNYEGTTELLAAEVWCKDFRACSFTRDLMDQLQSFGSDPFTVTELHERLRTSPKRLHNIPVYVPLSGRGRPSICIAPLRPGRAGATSSSPTPSGSQGPSSSPAAPTSPVSPLLTSTSPLYLEEDPRALLAISLTEKATPSNVESWTQWLASEAPASVREVHPYIRIEGVFPGNSALLLVSMPVSVWHHLEDDTAYRFVDFLPVA